VYLVQVQSPTNSSIVLLRHGQSTWNQLHLIQGQNDEAVLTEKGREQARLAAATFEEHRFDVIISSDLTRTLETAQIAGEELGLSIELAPELRERSYGVLEGRPASEMTVAESGISGYRVVDEDASPLEGETLRQLLQRAGNFMEQVRANRAGQRLLLVTHGGTIRAIRAYCQGESMMNMEWDRVGNCSIWDVTLPPKPR
jgi:2,3-bisphosphoglycerate-dependent phosphoglycerate mutase